jgi:hypothetical protein
MDVVVWNLDARYRPELEVEIEIEPEPPPAKERPTATRLDELFVDESA